MEIPPIPDSVLAKVRTACLALPEAEETRLPTGLRFKVSRRNFADVFSITDPKGKEFVMLSCRPDPEERQVLIAVGHPFFGIGRVRIGMIIDGKTDWTEFAELVTESYLAVAPKRLAERIESA